MIVWAIVVTICASRCLPRRRPAGSAVALPGRTCYANYLAEYEQSI